MEKNILWNTLLDENVYLRVTNNIRVKKKKFTTKNLEKVNKNKITDISLDKPDIINKINQIIKCDDTIIEKKTSLDLLKNQELITSYLSRYFIQNTKLNYTFVLTKVLWLMKISKLLGLRINQKVTNHVKNKKKNNNVSRSSYKFCIHNSQCEYNYGTKKKSCCSDHYVHTYIYADLQSLENYIKTKTIVNECFESNREITKCINTIAYVVRHMYDELRNVCLYQKEENYEKVHFNKSNRNFHVSNKKKNKRFNKSV